MTQRVPDQRAPSPVPAYLQVAEQLRRQILDGHLAAGDRLPPEVDLGEQFGVSRSTVREALRVLASRDLVRTRRGVSGGTFVNEVDATQVTQYLETSLGLMSGRDDLRIEEMLEAREILEIPCARLAAVRRNDDQLAALRESLERGNADEAGRFSEHSAFHRVLVAAAHNPMLTMLTEPLFRVLQTRLLRPEFAGRGEASVFDDHLVIYEAIEAADPERAGVLMERHLARLRGAYLG